MSLNTRLFVGNLPENFNEHVLRNAFSSYGEIVNFDLKCKPGLESDNKKRFAFITLSTSNYNVESCIKFFSNEDFHGNRLYVTRARESFLERLQREREQSKNKLDKQDQVVHLPIKKNNGEHHNTHKRKFNDEDLKDSKNIKKSKVKPAHEIGQQAGLIKPFNEINHTSNDKNLSNTFHNKQNKKPEDGNKKNNNLFQNDEKKQNSDKKRQESMKKKRQEFNEKKNIIKTGLVSVDKKSNKKIIFSDTEENSTVQEITTENGHDMQNKHKSTLFDDGGSDDEINFEVKKQYEGKKGQKVLDLQSRYKSDKRFVLDQRFVEDSDSEKDEGDNEVDLNQVDEKSKQMNILQDLLGVTIKSKSTDTSNKTKSKLGMLRFDPLQPEHAKYLVPVSTEEHTKKSKKKKSKETKEDESQKEPERVVEKVEVSKEQFYKISDSLKDTMTQPTTFSLRSLFRKEDDQQEGAIEDVDNDNYIPLQSKKDTKVKNPLDPGEKNPFQYDSSESENEEDINTNDMKQAPETTEIKTVWREKLFLSMTDPRLKDGLIFFGKPYENDGQKERRELKSLMKKRIYNKERKNTMFQKKIGGRKKTMRKKFRKN